MNKKYLGDINVYRVSPSVVCIGDVERSSFLSLNQVIEQYAFGAINSINELEEKIELCLKQEDG